MTMYLHQNRVSGQFFELTRTTFEEVASVLHNFVENDDVSVEFGPGYLRIDFKDPNLENEVSHFIIGRA